MGGVRQARKQETRQKVLDAARALFIDVGYEAATVRLIAQEAGVAIGSVFTTFPSKLAILRAVMEERLETLCAELEGVAPHLRGSTIDRLCSVMAVHYDFEMRRPRLFTAFLAANFEWAEGEPLITFGRQERLNAILRDILKRGVENGEVREDTDLDQFIAVMLAVYGFNYRHAAQDGLAASQLSSMMDRQIALMFSGIARR